MNSWWHRSGSLNWMNKKKLTKNITQFSTNTLHAKETLLSLLSLVNAWETHCKDLSEKSSKRLLSAKDVVDLKPLLEKSEAFKATLTDLCKELASHSLQDQNGNPPPP